MAKAGGNTIIVAGGGGSGGSKGGPSGSDKPKQPKGGGTFKMDDQTFYAVAGGLVLIGAVAYVYSSRPDLVNEFVGPFFGNRNPSVPSVPPAPTGTVQNDELMQQQPAGVAPEPTQGQWGGQMSYPQYPQQNQGSGYDQFQFPQQPQAQQQYQPYNPGQDFAGTQGFSTSFNPTFGQTSNMPTNSFAARVATEVEYDNSDGMLVGV